MLPRGDRAPLSFRILDGNGRPVRDFEEEQEKRMHLIVVRRDTQGFQHLHPRIDRNGRWTTPVTLPEAGSYRVFADFQRGGEKSTLGADVSVDGPVDWKPLPAPSSSSIAPGGYDIEITGKRSRAGTESELDFAVSRNGRPVQTCLLYTSPSPRDRS